MLSRKEIVSLAKQFLQFDNDSKKHLGEIPAQHYCFLVEITDLCLSLPQADEEIWYEIIETEDGKRFLLFDYRFDQAFNFLEHYANVLPPFWLMPLPPYLQNYPTFSWKLSSP